MIKIAITGNIASGKTTVQNIIERRGFKVLDTDKVGHDLLQEMPEIKETFKNQDIFDKDGKISREKLGQLVFRNKEAKEKLEQIIHPAIREKILSFFCKNANEEAVFVGIPLLFETNMNDIFDKILLIYTDDTIRKARLMARNNYTSEYAEIRMKSQQSQDEKKALCDDIIYNNSTQSDLETHVDEFLNRTIKR